MLCLTAPEGRAAPRVARAANTALAAAPSYARHVPERTLLYALARIFHRSRATNEDGIALVCPKIQVSNLDQRAGNAEAKLYRRN